MIGGVIMVSPRGPRRSRLQRLLGRKPRPTLRQLGAIVSDLQNAEARNIHADHERCLGCKIAAGMLHSMACAHLPDRYRKDADWWHRHVTMPGARKAARIVDEQEADR